MSLHPAQQEAPKKPKTKRATRSKASAKRQAAAKEQLAMDASDDSLESTSGELNSAAVQTIPPVFVQRDLKGPDGSIRSGWEMWIGDHCFGRADSKELLLASFERLQSPPSSFHWREVRNRMPMRNRPKTQPEEPEAANEPAASAPSEKNNSWSWDDDQEGEPLVADEESEGFLGLSWETPAQ